MKEPNAYVNGDFCSDLTLSVDDLGVLQGVAVSERIRTFHGQLFRLEDHLQRLANSLQIVDVQLNMSLEHVGEIATDLALRNYPQLEPGDDLGLSLFVTPGTAHARQPTVAMQCYPLPFEHWASYYTQGQSLMETGVRQVPPSCWPLDLKCRSRMHYYLADQRADRMDPGSRAILLDQEGCVTEASTANIVFCRDDVGIVSPPLHRILSGVSLSVLDELAQGLNIPMHYRDFGLEELATADEILLCSTSPCVWPVTRLNKQRVGQALPGPIFQKLSRAWGDLVQLDIAAQAQQFAHRHPHAT